MDERKQYWRASTGLGSTLFPSPPVLTSLSRFFCRMFDDDEKESGSAPKVNFQKASCTIDASVKIYSHRLLLLFSIYAVVVLSRYLFFFFFLHSIFLFLVYFVLPFCLFHFPLVGVSILFYPRVCLSRDRCCISGESVKMQRSINRQFFMIIYYLPT